MKKTVIFLLILTLTVSLWSFRPQTARAATEPTLKTVGEVMNMFPEGAYWNHVTKEGHAYNGTIHQGALCGDIENTWTTMPCADHKGEPSVGQCDCNSFENSTQCCGFAKKVANLVYGASYIKKSWPSITNISAAVAAVKPGDVVHYYGNGVYTSTGHWIFVTGVEGSVVSIGECNYGKNCIIKWSRTMDLSKVSSLTLYQAPYALTDSEIPERTTRMTLDEMMAAFPHNAYWNHLTKEGHGYTNGYTHVGDACGDTENSWSNTPCATHSGTAKLGEYDCNSFEGSIQSKGFAKKLSDMAYGYSCLSWKKITDKTEAMKAVKPGDVIHYTGYDAVTSSGHWIFVTGVCGTRLTAGETDAADCRIVWDKVLEITDLPTLELYQAPYKLTGGTLEIVPVITKQPADYVGKLGTSAAFTVEVSGENLTYRWQVNTGDKWKNVSSASAGYNTAILPVTLTAARNGYRYRCVITDDTGHTVTSREASLTKAAPPELKILSQPESYTGLLNTTAVLKVGAQGEDLSYLWQVCTETGWRNLTTGAFADTLSVKMTAARDGYRYRCLVMDASGTILLSEPALMTLRHPLTVTKAPESYQGERNTTARFTVAATGEKITYQWQVNTGTAWKNVTSTGYNKPTLPVVLTDTRQGYQYRCVLTDAYGDSVTTDPVTLGSRPKPAVTGQPTSYTGALGSTAELRVTAEGRNLTYQWQVNTGADWKNVTSTGYNKAAMNVTLTKARNGYQYRCVITDAFGESAASDAALICIG